MLVCHGVFPFGTICIILAFDRVVVGVKGLTNGVQTVDLVKDIKYDKMFRTIV
jgi:hypothetical protein